jgi:hypothetical protein
LSEIVGGPGAALKLPEIDIGLPVAEVSGTVVPEESQPTPGKERPPYLLISPDLLNFKDATYDPVGTGKRRFSRAGLNAIRLEPKLRR